MSCISEHSRGSIKFVYYNAGQSFSELSSPETKICYEIDAECNLTEACKAFENFLLACGFRLNEGETLKITTE